MKRQIALSMVLFLLVMCSGCQQAFDSLVAGDGSIPLYTLPPISTDEDTYVQLAEDTLYYNDYFGLQVVVPAGSVVMQSDNMAIAQGSTGHYDAFIPGSYSSDTAEVIELLGILNHRDMWPMTIIAKPRLPWFACGRIRVLMPLPRRFHSLLPLIAQNPSAVSRRLRYEQRRSEM